MFSPNKAGYCAFGIGPDFADQIPEVRNFPGQIRIFSKVTPFPFGRGFGKSLDSSGKIRTIRNSSGKIRIYSEHPESIRNIPDPFRKKDFGANNLSAGGREVTFSYFPPTPYPLLLLLVASHSLGSLPPSKSPNLHQDWSSTSLKRIHRRILLGDMDSGTSLLVSLGLYV